MARAARAAAPPATALTFLVDTNIAVYSHVPSRYHDACLEVIEAVAAGIAPGRMSTAVLEEIWHVELSGKARPTAGLARRMYVVFTPLLAVTDEVVARALALTAPRLGANDRIHVATALAHGIDTILTADAAFDGIPGLRRVDPADDAARSRLLRG